MCRGMTVNPVPDSAHLEGVKTSHHNLGWETGNETAFLSQDGQSSRLPSPARAEQEKRGPREIQRLDEHWLQLARIINLVGVGFPGKGGTA